MLYVQVCHSSARNSPGHRGKTPTLYTTDHERNTNNQIYVQSKKNNWLIMMLKKLWQKRRFFSPEQNRNVQSWNQSSSTGQIVQNQHNPAHNTKNTIRGIIQSWKKVWWYGECYRLPSCFNILAKSNHQIKLLHP